MTASNQAQREWIIHHQVNKEFLATCTQRRPGPAWITIYNSSLRGPAAPHGTKFPTFIHLWGRRWPCHHPPANTGSTRQAPDTAIVDSTNTSTNLSCISVLKAFQMFCLVRLSSPPDERLPSVILRSNGFPSVVLPSFLSTVSFSVFWSPAPAFGFAATFLSHFRRESRTYLWFLAIPIFGINAGK